MPFHGRLNNREPVNFDHPLNWGRLAWWLALPRRFGGPNWFDLVDDLPGSLTGFSSGNGWAFPSNLAGTNSLLCNGTSTYLNAGTAASVKPTAITVAAWVNANNYNGSGFSNVAARLQSTSPFGWALELTAGKPRFLAANSSASAAAVSTSALVKNNWYHLAGTFDNTTVRCYVNGVQTASATLSGSLFNSSTANLVLSNHLSTAGDYWNGYLNDVGIWDYALSASAISELYLLTQKSYDPLLNRIPDRTVFLLSSTGPNQVAGSAMLTGEAQIIPASTESLAGSVKLTGESQLILASTESLAGSIKLTGESYLLPAPQVSYQSLAQLTGEAQLIASGTNTSAATAASPLLSALGKSRRGRIKTREPLNEHYPLNWGRIAFWPILRHLWGGSKLFDLVDQAHLTIATSSGNVWSGSAPAGLTGSLTLSGTSASLTNGAEFNLLQGCISGWINSTVSVSTQAIGFFSQSDTLTKNGITLFMDVTTGYLKATFANNVGALLTLTGNTALNDGKWHHWCVNYNTGVTKSCTIYVDGVQQATNTLPNNFNFGTTPSPIYLGNINDSAFHTFLGNLSHVSYWNRNLSSNEVVEDFRHRTEAFNRQQSQPVFGASSAANPVAGSVMLTGVAALLLTPGVKYAGSTQLLGDSRLLLSPGSSLAGQTMLTGASQLIPASTLQVAGATKLLGEARLIPTGKWTAGGQIFLMASSQLSASPKATYAGTAWLLNDSAFYLTTVGLQLASAQLLVSSSLGAKPTYFIYPIGPKGKIKLHEESPFIFTPSGNFTNPNFPAGATFIVFDPSQATAQGTVVSAICDLGDAPRTTLFEWRGRVFFQNVHANDCDVEFYAIPQDGIYADGGLGSGTPTPTQLHPVNLKTLGLARYNPNSSVAQVSGKTVLKDRFVRLAALLPASSGQWQTISSSYLLLNPIPVEQEDT